MVPQDGVYAEWVSLTRVTGAPVVLGFNAGAQAREIEQMDGAATSDAALAALRTMFGSSFPAPLGAHMTRWASDPLARGAYSFNPVGTNADTRRALSGADWDGRMVFAGERSFAASAGLNSQSICSRKAQRSLGQRARFSRGGRCRSFRAPRPPLRLCRPRQRCPGIIEIAWGLAAEV